MCVGGCQRTTYNIQYSLYTMWFPGIELWSLSSTTKAVTYWAWLLPATLHASLQASGSSIHVLICWISTMLPIIPSLGLIDLLKLLTGSGNQAYLFTNDTHEEIQSTRSRGRNTGLLWTCHTQKLHISANQLSESCALWTHCSWITVDWMGKSRKACVHQCCSAALLV